jgi:hypothetical protein
VYEICTTGVIFAFMSEGWFSDRDEGGRAIAVRKSQERE